MKLRYCIPIVVGLFVLGLIVDRSSNLLHTDRLRWMASLDWTITALGVGIAGISGLRLLHAALQGAKLPQIMPFAVGLLAGLSLYQRFWPNATSLAAVLITWLVVEYFRPSAKEPGN